jgi:hypothetical protein
MTIGVVTVAYGDTYRAFLPEWAQAIGALHTQPNQVTIATDFIAPEIADLVAEHLPQAIWVISPRVPIHHPQVLVNDAIGLTRTDWICKMDVDDIIYPHALDAMDDLPCDVFMFGICLQGHDMLPNNVTGEQVLDCDENLVFSGSPFRRWLWEANQYRDMIYEDWAFWRDAARAGAKFFPSWTIDYEYRLHGDNISTGCDDAYWREAVRAIHD